MGNEKKVDLEMIRLLEEADKATINFYDPGKKERLHQLLNQVIAMDYQDARLERLIRIVIESSKKDFIALLQEEAQLDKDQKQALELIQSLRQFVAALENGSRIGMPHIYELRRHIHALRDLFTKEVRVTQAIETLSRRIEALMKQVQKED